ncbi:MAG: hypothetical protein ACLGHV_12610, partial [Gammaproteobacteria bacterium]
MSNRRVAAIKKRPERRFFIELLAERAGHPLHFRKPLISNGLVAVKEKKPATVDYTSSATGTS